MLERDEAEQKELCGKKFVQRIDDLFEELAKPIEGGAGGKNAQNFGK